MRSHFAFLTCGSTESTKSALLGRQNRSFLAENRREISHKSQLFDGNFHSGWAKSQFYDLRVMIDGKFRCGSTDFYFQEEPESDRERGGGIFFFGIAVFSSREIRSFMWM